MCSCISVPAGAGAAQLVNPVTFVVVGLPRVHQSLCATSSLEARLSSVLFSTLL